VSLKTAHLQNISDIKGELFRLIEGMDYCLDWKPNPDSWSVRDVICHMLDTPEKGIHRLIEGIIHGDLREFNLEPDLLDVTPERLANDIDQLRRELGQILEGLEQAVSHASESDFEGKTILAHLIAYGRDEERTTQSLLEGLFDRHWRGHLGQISSLKEALGV